MFYDDALAELKRSKIPIPIITLHLLHGRRDGAVCGGCAAWLEYVEAGPKGQIVTKHYCRRSYSAMTVPAETPACGKWHDKRETTPPADVRVIEDA